MTYLPASAPPRGPSQHAVRLRGIATLAASIFGILCGFWLGQPIGYELARLLGRDPADLKGMLIACFIAMPFFMSALFAWLALTLTGARPTSRDTARAWLAFVTVGTVVLVIGNYDWPKSSGIPVVEYELRLPAEAAVSDRHQVSLTVWSETGGTGCYIHNLQQFAGRPQLTGHIVVQTNNEKPTMSLRLVQAAAADESSATFVQKSPEGYWRLPYSPQSQLETEFSPWQAIEFISAPRAVPALPPGRYEIRYRLSEFM